MNDADSNALRAAAWRGVGTLAPAAIDEIIEGCLRIGDVASLRSALAAGCATLFTYATPQRDGMDEEKFPEESCLFRRASTVLFGKGDCPPAPDEIASAWVSVLRRERREVLDGLLTTAVFKGHLGWCGRLVEAGADPLRRGTCIPALSMAISCDLPEAIALMLPGDDRGMPFADDPRGETALRQVIVKNTSRMRSPCVGDERKDGAPSVIDELRAHIRPSDWQAAIDGAMDRAIEAVLHAAYNGKTYGLDEAFCMIGLGGRSDRFEALRAARLKSAQGGNLLHLVAVGVDASDAAGWDALYTTVGRFCLERAGFDPMARDARQYTALHIAAHYGNQAVARLLIEAGADPCDTGIAAGESNHRTIPSPIDLARSGGHDELVAMLQAGAARQAVHRAAGLAMAMRP